LHIEQINENQISQLVIFIDQLISFIVSL